MLFYQRRDIILNNTDHWATRLHAHISNSHSLGQIVDNIGNLNFLHNYYTLFNI